MNMQDMSENELRIVIKEANKQIEELQKEKEQHNHMKQNYKLIHPAPEYRMNYTEFYKLVKNMIESGKCIDSETMESISKLAQYEVPNSKESIYPCPRCGKVDCLYAGKYDDLDLWGMGTHKIRITCSKCDFVCNTEYQENEYDAWESFHNWLIKHNYLDSTVKFDVF